MHIKNLLTSFNVRKRHRDLSIKTTGAKKRRIENVGAVGGRDNDDSFLGVETVHLNKKRIQGLLALVVTTAHALAPMASDRVNFVDKNKAGSMLFALLEHIANAACTDSNEHLDEVRTTDRKERDISLTGNCAGQEGLAGSRRTHHQYPLGNRSPESLELARVAKEVNDLIEFFFCFLDAGNVLEGHLVLVHCQELGLGFAEAHCAPPC